MQLNEKSYFHKYGQRESTNTSLVQLNPEDETREMRKNN